MEIDMITPYLSRPRELVHSTIMLAYEKDTLEKTTGLDGFPFKKFVRMFKKGIRHASSDGGLLPDRFTINHLWRRSEYRREVGKKMNMTDSVLEHIYRNIVKMPRYWNLEAEYGSNISRRLYKICRSDTPAEFSASLGRYARNDMTDTRVEYMERYLEKLIMESFGEKTHG